MSILWDLDTNTEITTIFNPEELTNDNYVKSGLVQENYDFTWVVYDKRLHKTYTPWDMLMLQAIKEKIKHGEDITDLLYMQTIVREFGGFTFYKRLQSICN